MPYPTYNHPFTSELINHKDELPKEKIDEGLALPRQTFIEDLENFITDLQTRRNDYYQDNDYNLNFLIYALGFLYVLEAKQSFPKIIEVLEEDEQFIDYWFGQFVEPSYVTFLAYPIFKDDFETLLEIIEHNNHNYLVKSGLINIPAQVAINETKRRKEAIGFYEKLIDFVLKQDRENPFLEGFEVDALIHSVFLIEGTELREKVLKLHNEKLTDEEIWDKKSTFKEFQNFDYSIRSDKKINLDLTPYEIFDRLLIGFFTYPLNEEEQEKVKKDFRESAANNGFVLDEDDQIIETDQPRSSYDPKTNKPLYGRNDKVTVKYEDGKVVENVKYKKVEKDVKEGKCIILDV
ncbi:DUF1186 domain-containing protein [Bernardetia sp. Wsw4-3y2]|uniref:DUF1186 domain-containing protein n=1 Tax=Bernardetia sp. Wsw4-3y2 TaxID=3127471 RepID=UPI0030CB5ECA